MNELPVADMGGGPILIIPLRIDRIRAPAFRIPEGERCWLFGLLRAAAPGDVPRLQAENLVLYEQGIRIGALRYPCDSLQQPNDPDGWSRHYGERWEQVCRVRDAADPKRRLGPNRWIEAASSG